MVLVTFIFAETLIIFSTLLSKQYLLGCCLTVFAGLLATPKNIFSFSSIILANFGLYIVVPSFIVLFLNYVEYDYKLLWIKNISEVFLVVDKNTFLLITSVFIILFGSVKLLEDYVLKTNAQNIDVTSRISPNLIHLIKRKLYYLVPISLLLNTYIFIQMGGSEKFFSDYSNTFLTQRTGLGPIIIITSAFFEITIFLLGLLKTSQKSSLNRYFYIALILILFNGFVMGFKSRVLILLLLFYIPQILKLKFSLRALGLFSIVFFPLLMFLSYIRTNGYYSGILLVEMFVSYFNVIPLHLKIVSDFEPNSIFSMFWFLNKIPHFLGTTNSDYDLSIYLTKIYYPAEWYNENATQQWSLISQIYLNFGNSIAIIIPCFWIITKISVSMYIMHKKINGLFLLFFVIMETLWFLVIFKGGILHYDLIYQFIKYTLAFLILWSLKFGNSTVVKRRF